MRVVRAFEDTPQQPRRGAFLSRIVGLPGRIVAAIGAGFARVSLAPGLGEGHSDEDLWFLIVASDPDGVWYPWAADEDRRPHVDQRYDRR